MIKTIIIAITFLLFSGCELDLLHDKELEQLKKENARLQAEQQAELIRLEHKNDKLKMTQAQELEMFKLDKDLKREQLANEKETALATIEKERQVERLALENELKKEQLAKERAKELELIRQKTVLVEAEKALELKKYIFALAALLLLIVAFFIYYYLKRKREDKLIAYNDNLKKYFQYKESETRTRIAEKVLDTIAEGKLSKEDQVNLIKAISSTTPMAENQGIRDESIDIELIEDKS